MTANVSEDRWLTRLRGEPAVRDEAIAELRELIRQGLSRSLTHRYGGGLQVDDVAQDALMKVLVSLDQFEGRSRFTTWAMTIATRIGISALRRKRFRDVSLEAMKGENGLQIELAVDNQTPTEMAIDRQAVLETLHDLIETQLSDKQKVAVRGLLEGVPVEEIARLTNSNRNAVYKLIHDARVKLREGFEHAGILTEDIRAIFA